MAPQQGSLVVSAPGEIGRQLRCLRSVYTIFTTRLTIDLGLQASASRTVRIYQGTDRERVTINSPWRGSQLVGKGQDIADDRVTGFDSACSRTNQCDFAQEISAVSNSIGGSTNTI